MKHFRISNATRLIAGLLFGLLFAVIAVPLGAQPASESRPGRGFGPLYDAAHETTVNGTIQQVVTKRVLGSPAGLHLMVAGPKGIVDAHVGSFLSKDTRAVLQAGMPVRIVGANVSLHGKNYLLARELSAGGRTVAVRGPGGFLVHTMRPRVVKARRTARAEKNGGIR